MNNKAVINKLKDNAELAWAAYGYFHLANPRYDFNKDSTDKERLKYFRKKNRKKSNCYSYSRRYSQYGTQIF